MFVCEYVESYIVICLNNQLLLYITVSKRTGVGNGIKTVVTVSVCINNKVRN